MQDLLKYNVAPKIEKMKDSFSIDRILSLREKFTNNSQDNKNSLKM